MRKIPVLPTLLCLFAASFAPVLAHDPPAPVVPSPPSPTPKKADVEHFPPCPPGVTHVAWGALIKTPVGPLGLELTDTIKSLDGKKVRLLGYMVRRDEPVPGAFWLAPYPVNIEESESGFADLPPQAVYVLVPYNSKTVAPYTPRPLLLTGTLSVGKRPGDTGDGALSLFRLTLDAPPEPPRPAPAPAPPKER